MAITWRIVFGDGSGGVLCWWWKRMRRADAEVLGRSLVEVGMLSDLGLLLIEQLEAQR